MDVLETPAYSGLPMASVEHNAELNRLVVDLGCTLLQFTGEVSPWSPANATAARETLVRVIKQQQDHSEQIVQLLVDRGWPVEFGTYPAEFTDLHFLSLKALLPRIIENQNAIIVELDEAAHACVDDASATEVLNAVLAGERGITAELKAITV